MEYLLMFTVTVGFCVICAALWYLLNASDIIDRDTAANTLRCSLTGTPCDNCNCEGEEE